MQFEFGVMKLNIIKSTIFQKLKIAKFRTKSVSELCVSFVREKNEDDSKKLFDRPYLSRKLKIAKFIFHSFQNIAQLFGPKI